MPGKADPGREQALQDCEETFGSPPPLYLSVAFMRKALAYDEQCRHHAGNPRRIARPGAHLVREWNGRTYQVEVLKDGYRMDGRTWPSLSAIAKHITGTTWSGPRFFGLADRAGGDP